VSGPDTIEGTGVPLSKTVVHVGSIALDTTVALAPVAMANMRSFIAAVVWVRLRDMLSDVEEDGRLAHKSAPGFK
jgi:hypothetical protein